MNFSNVLYFSLLILFGYILHSYIKSYNEIVDELKRIRIKCVINNKYTKDNQNDTHNKIKGKTNTNKPQLNDVNINNTQNNDNIDDQLNIDENDQLNIDDNDKINIDDNDKINIDDNDKINIDDNDQLNIDENDQLNIDENDEYTNIDVHNNNKDNKKIINFTKLSTTNNDSYSENFTNYSKERDINNWKSYKDNIVSSCEGFQNCPYKGYNVDLYETLINSNTVTKNTHKNTNQLGWEQSDLLNANEKSHNGWCYLDSLNNNKCVPVSKKQNCKGTFYKHKKECKET